MESTLLFTDANDKYVCSRFVKLQQTAKISVSSGVRVENLLGDLLSDGLKVCDLLHIALSLLELR